MADLITRLRVESSEYDSKIQRAAKGLLHMEEACRKVGGTLASLEKDKKEFVQGLGQMQTVSNTARGKIAELTAAFTDLSAQYNRLTQEEKNGDFGRALSSSLDQLKTRIQAGRAELDQITNSLKTPKSGMEQLSGVVNTLGSKLGVTGDLTSILTSKTTMLTAGISASVVVISKATEAWAKYNAEMSKQDQITTVTTGLKGTDADDMTDKARALVDTYNVEFREAINAANTLMTQFGKSGEEAMSLIRDGMRGMINGDGTKLLSMIQQYAPSFRDAGIEASQLIAIIQNSEGGLFTDENMNAIVMGIKNIRLMTKATSDALAMLGVDGQEMTKKLNDGSMTIFEAMQQVSQAINGAGSASQAAGEVMQQVFGRQGVAAGTKLGEAIATLNTNIEETKRQTGELGDAYNDLYDANVRLNKAIRDCFEYDGWDQMATGIKSKLVSALAAVVEKLGEVRKMLFGISGKEARESLGGDNKINQQISMLGNGRSQRSRNTYNRQVAEYESYIDDRNNYLNALQMWRQGDRSESVGNAVQIGRERFGIDERKIRQQTQAAYGMLENYRKKAEKLFETPIEEKITTKTGPKKTDPKKTTKEKTDEQLNNEQIQKLTQEYIKASDERRKAIEKEIKTLQTRNEEIQKLKDIAQGKIKTDGSLPALTRELQDLQKKQSEATNGKEWDEYQKKINETTDKINILKGNLPKDKQATFTVEVNTDQLTQLYAQLPTDGKNIKINVEQGNVDLPEIPTDDETVKVNITADTADAMKQVRDLTASIDGVQAKIVPIKVEPDTTAIDGFGDKMVAKIRQEAVDAAQEADFSSLATFIKNGIMAGIEGWDETGKRLYQMLLNKDDIDPADLDDFLNTIHEQLKGKIDEKDWPKIKVNIENLNFKPIENFNKQVEDSGKKTQDAWNAVAGSISKIGSALNSIESPAAKIAAIIMQGIAETAQGAGAAISKAGSTTSTWYEYIAAAASITGSMISTIAQIHSVTGYAQGGIVKGNSYSGDRIGGVVDGNEFVGLNAGEVVLTRAMQGNLAEQLEGGGRDTAQPSVPYVTGDTVVLGINNYLQGTGQGEMVTTGMLRNLGII